MRTRTLTQVARAYQRQIAKLQREREKLYLEALHKLKIPATNAAFDYFMNDQQGYSAFEESL